MPAVDCDVLAFTRSTIRQNAGPERQLCILSQLTFGSTASLIRATARKRGPIMSASAVIEYDETSEIPADVFQPPLGDPRRAVHEPDHHRHRQHLPERRPAEDVRGARPHQQPAAVGGRRLLAGLRRHALHRRHARRPLRPQGLHAGRHRPVRRSARRTPRSSPTRPPTSSPPAPSWASAGRWSCRRR